MVELEEAAFAAASSVVGDERAAALISVRSWESVREEACVIVMAIDTTVFSEASARLPDASTRSRSASARVLVEAATESARFPRRGRRGVTPLANRCSA